MPSGETLLKFTDYPFAYSIMAMFMGSIGVSLSQDHFIFLGIAGAFGTLLTVVDPIGGIIRNIETKYLEKRNKKIIDLTFKLSALKTKAITFEIEKILGLFYFIILILAFAIAITIPSPFFDKLIQKDILEILQLNELQLKSIFLLVSAIVIGVLVIRATKFWNELDNEIEIAAYHLIAINNDNATQTSIQNMTRAIEQNDWTLAELWKGKIREEIKYKKGKRELIIKAADSVFSPLHFEASEFKKYLQDRKEDPFKDFNTEKWMKIKQNSHQSIVEDTQLRRRIENFYNTMNVYNKNIPNLFLKVNEIIKKHFSKELNENVDSVEIHLDFPNSGITVPLPTCGLFGINPLEFDPTSRKFGNLKMHIITEGNKTIHREIKQHEVFDKVWGLVINEIRRDDLIVKMNEYLKNLEIENRKLMGIYSKKIQMQWDV